MTEAEEIREMERQMELEEIRREEELEEIRAMEREEVQRQEDYQDYLDDMRQEAAEIQANHDECNPYLT